jgi:hypothetical protein
VQVFRAFDLFDQKDFVAKRIDCDDADKAHGWGFHVEDFKSSCITWHNHGCRVRLVKVMSGFAFFLCAKPLLGSRLIGALIDEIMHRSAMVFDVLYSQISRTPANST